MHSLEEEKNEIEETIRQYDGIPNHNYFFAERSIHPVLQLRGNSVYNYIARKPYWVAILDKDILINKCWEKHPKKRIKRVPMEAIRDFDVERLSPFNEYCISFKYDKMYYFYVADEANEDFRAQSYSWINVDLLLGRKFNGLLRDGSIET